VPLKTVLKQNYFLFILPLKYKLEIQKRLKIIVKKISKNIYLIAKIMPGLVKN